MNSQDRMGDEIDQCTAVLFGRWEQRRQHTFVPILLRLRLISGKCL